MTDPNRTQQPQQVEELTAAIKEMANRVTVQFVQDEQKTRTFIAARKERERRRAQAD
jgi:spore germination cell wall hydrolase CwlJ-like protein